MRLQSGIWRQALVRDAYFGLHDQLCKTWGVRDADRMVSLLFEYCKILPKPKNAKSKHQADISVLQLMAQDPENQTLVLSTFEALCLQFRWTGKYMSYCRTLLSRSLCLLSPTLSLWLNPLARKPISNNRLSPKIATPKSHESSWSFIECLPQRLRRLPLISSEVRLIHQIGRQMMDHFRSISRLTLKSILLLVDSLINGSATCSATPMLEGGQSVETYWQILKTIPASVWLQRYELLYAGKSLSAVTFDRHMRWLAILHNKVLSAESNTKIPVLIRYSDTPTSATAMYSSSDADFCVTQNGTREVKQQMHALRHNLVPQAQHDCSIVKRYAFTPNEVTLILENCGTVFEKLIAIIFLTLGVRIGGLARLQFHNPVQYSDNIRGVDIPKEAFTIEKGNVMRQVRLNDTCRILIAKWYRTGRPVPAQPVAYIFPSFQQDSSRSPVVSTSHIWKTCRKIFERAAIRGPHVHPHTFRHTVIQMMFLCVSDRFVGISFFMSVIGFFFVFALMYLSDQQLAILHSNLVDVKLVLQSPRGVRIHVGYAENNTALSELSEQMDNLEADYHILTVDASSVVVVYSRFTGCLQYDSNGNVLLLSDIWVTQSAKHCFLLDFCGIHVLCSNDFARYPGLTDTLFSKVQEWQAPDKYIDVPIIGTRRVPLFTMNRDPLLGCVVARIAACAASNVVEWWEVLMTLLDCYWYDDALYNVTADLVWAEMDYVGLQLNFSFTSFEALFGLFLNAKYSNIHLVPCVPPGCVSHGVYSGILRPVCCSLSILHALLHLRVWVILGSVHFSDNMVGTLHVRHKTETVQSVRWPVLSSAPYQLGRFAVWPGLLYKRMVATTKLTQMNAFMLILSPREAPHKICMVDSRRFSDVFQTIQNLRDTYADWCVTQPSGTDVGSGLDVLLHSLVCHSIYQLRTHEIKLPSYLQ